MTDAYKTICPGNTSPDAPSKAIPLFRPEILSMHSSQRIGSIRLAQPISTWLIAAIASVIAASFLTYVAVGSFTRKTRVTGITVPLGGNLSIAAQNSGVLLASHVQEGERVRAGQTLFTLSTERKNAGGEITALVAQQLASRLGTLTEEHRLRQIQYQEKKTALEQRLANAQLELNQLEQEIGLANRRQVLAQQSLSKYEELQASGYVSSAQTQQKQEDSIDVAARLSTLMRNRTQLLANQLSLQAELKGLATNLAADLAQLDRAKFGLKQEIAENSGRGSIDITSPQTGTVTTITNQTGQAIANGQVLATLIPDTYQSCQKSTGDDNLRQGRAAGTSSPECKTANPHIVEAHLYASSRTAGFIQPGQQVQLRYAAFPYQKFGLQLGTITDISATPFAPAELPQHIASTVLSNAQQNINGFNSNEALYRIKVKLQRQTIITHNQVQNIKPGMTLEADLLQEKRRIWEWIVEPILAVSATTVAAQ